MLWTSIWIVVLAIGAMGLFVTVQSARFQRRVAHDARALWAAQTAGPGERLPPLSGRTAPRREIRGVVPVGFSHYPVAAEGPKTRRGSWALGECMLFINALERGDPAYLDAACAGRQALRKRIDGLLRSYEEKEGDFLAVPTVRLDQVRPAGEHTGGWCGVCRRHPVAAALGWARLTRATAPPNQNADARPGRGFRRGRPGAPFFSCQPALGRVANLDPSVHLRG